MIADYQERVLAAVHALRVDPFDDVTKLMLADLIDEHGRKGANERTCEHLRRGLIVVNSLDLKVLQLLKLCKCLRRSGDESRIYNIDIALSLSAVLACDKYKLLWELAWKYRKQIMDKAESLNDLVEVMNEIRLVRKDKLAKIRRDKKSREAKITELSFTLENDYNTVVVQAPSTEYTNKRDGSLTWVTTDTLIHLTGV